MRKIAKEAWFLTNFNLGKNQVDQSFSTGSWLKLQLKQLTITCSWRESGCSMGGAIFGENIFLILNSQIWTHGYAHTVEFIVHGAPSVQICELSHSNLKKIHEKEKFVKGKSVCR